MKALAVAVLAAFLVATNGAAADTIRVARSGVDIAFAVPEIGRAAKIWEKYGLEVQVLDVPGTRIEQVLVAGDADVGLGAGVALGFRVKGVPNTGVAVVANRPYNFALIVLPDSPIRTVDDLKGKSIGVTTANSITEWLVRETARRQGWGTSGITATALGDETARIAALRSGNIDADLSGLMQAFTLEDRHQARIVTYFGDIVTDFHTLVITAADRFIAEHPDRLRRFLAGWFETVAYMKSHREEGVRVVTQSFGFDPQAVAKAYDVEMKMMSDDGAFSPAAMDVIRHSLVELGILDKLPDAKSLYSDQFVPVKPGDAR